MAIWRSDPAHFRHAAVTAACAGVVWLTGCSGVDVKPNEPRNRGEVDTSGENMSNSGSFFGPRERARELDAALPPAPAKGDLLPFDLRNSTDLKAALDGRSLAVGKDGVVRYVLVLTSPRGVRNVSYEGIRCDPAEWKMYAVGREDGTWSQLPDPEWRVAEQQAWNSIRFTLAKDYVCEATGLPARDAATIVRRIKSSVPKRNTRTYN